MRSTRVGGLLPRLSLIGACILSVAGCRPQPSEQAATPIEFGAPARPMVERDPTKEPFFQVANATEERARRDARDAIARGDLRPRAYPSVMPEGGWAWVHAGFRCVVDGGRGQHRLSRSDADRLGEAMYGYVLHYNLTVTKLRECRPAANEVLIDAYVVGPGDPSASAN